MLQSKFFKPNILVTYSSGFRLPKLNTDEFENSWDNQTRAESYSKLEFPNTYYLAYRDLPEIIGKQATLKRAIDFGCGTGRSTRFLK